MTINGEIFTKLSVKEVSYISAVLYATVDNIKEHDDEMVKEYSKIANRLTNELYDYPNVDHTGQHEQIKELERLLSRALNSK